MAKSRKDPKHFACRLCRLGHSNLSEHVTRWFFVGVAGIVVEDLESDDYPLRLLFVPAQHKALGEETFQMRAVASQLLTGISKMLEVESSYKVVNHDMNAGSDHWYARFTLDWK